jgi:drug/metabolite transporter (DMT)-like permease
MRIALTRKDLFDLSVLTLLWGLNWPVMKLGVRDFPPVSFRTLCLAGGAIVLALIARAQGHRLRIDRRDWREMLLLTMANMMIWGLLCIYAVKLLSSGRAAILAYTMPVWVAVIGSVVYRDRMDTRMTVGIGAACVAIALLLFDEFSTLTGRPLGTILMLVAAFLWAVGTQWMRRRTLKLPLSVLSFWMVVLSLVVCAAISIVFERDQWVRWPDTAEWCAVLYNVVLVFGVSQMLWFRLASILPPVASGLSVMLIPVVGVFSAMWMLGEVPGWADYAALAFVLMSIATVLLPTRKTGKPAT